MVTDLDLAQVCSDLYFNTNKIDRIVSADGVTVGINHNSDHSIICFRGSTTVEDWLRDFQAQMIVDNQIGGVEFGFLQGIRQIAGERPDLDATPEHPVYITGHSLGAARALVFAALELATGLPSSAIARVTVFGPPRPGAARIKELLAPLNVRLYRNRMDPVCEVPVDIPMVDPYTHVCDLLKVNVAPPDNDPWGPFADHHMELYLQAMKNAFPPAALIA